MEKSDVLVAGAGPVGLYLAGLLEKAGLKVTVLEEHENIGRPNHCSGLVSRNLRLFLRPDSEWIEHRVSGAIIRCGPSFIRLKKPGPAAYVIDRERFDASLARGLDVRTGTRVEGVALGVEGVTLKTASGIFRAKMLLGCDGANSAVARHFGSRPRRLLMGVIGITREENRSEDVEIIIDKKAAPCGFFWKIPRGDTTEYGLFSRNADFLDLEEFFSIKPAERRAGLIPMGPGKSYFPRTLLVGDAAGMSKPWSGGGLIYGLTAARQAAITVLDAFEWTDFSEDFLARYERRWRAALGKQLRMGMLGRSLFGKSGDFEIRMALEGLGFFQPVLNRLDMDFLV